MSSLFIGLMSGTSLDGIDGVVVEFDSADGSPGLRILGHERRDFAAARRAELAALNRSGDDEIHRAALAANSLARDYAALVQTLLTSTSLGRDRVAAIGCHGQTVRHRPGEFDGTGYTVQLNAPALLAELTGIESSPTSAAAMSPPGARAHRSSPPSIARSSAASRRRSRC